LEAADEAVQKSAGHLREPSLALTLVAVSRRLFETCSPAPRMSPGGEAWDRRRFRRTRVYQPIELEFPAHEYEAAVRTQITLAGVRDCLAPLQGFTPDDLLAALEKEIGQAAIAAPPGAGTVAGVVAEHRPPIVDDPGQLVAGMPDSIMFLGEKRYQVGDQAHCVTEIEDNVLQAFLMAPGHVHSKSTLAKAAGVDEAQGVGILRRLKGTISRPPKYGGLFQPYVELPGGKGRGGYKVRIKAAEGRESGDYPPTSADQDSTTTAPDKS